MDSPSPPDDEGGVAMDTVSSSLRPTQEMVGGASTHHVQIMKASFFSQDDLNTTYSIPGLPQGIPQGVSQGFSQGLLHTSLLTNGTVPSPKPPPKPTFPSFQGGFPPPPQVAETLDPFTRFHGTTRRPLPLAQRAPTASGLQAQSAVLMARRNLNVLVPVPPGRERCLCDHGLFLGRSFRVGWGPNWTLAHSGSLVSPSAPPSKIAPSSSRGWGQGFVVPAEEEGHPIRVVVERVNVNSLPNSCGTVSQSFQRCHVTVM